MPQIAQLSETLASQIFWALIFFGFVFFVIGRGMVPKVMANVELRDKQVDADLAAAQTARSAAEAEDRSWQAQAARQREESQALIAKAKVEATKTAEGRLGEANKVIDARQAEADTRIAAARTSALAEIESIAAEAATEIVSRLAGIRVDAAAGAAAVKEAFHG